MVKKAGKLIKKQETPKSTLACDGNMVYRQEGSGYRSQKYTGPNELYTGLEPWTGFFTTKHSLRASYAANGSEALRYVGKGLVEGVLCDVIAFNYSSTISGESNGIVSEIRSENEGYLYFGPDKLVRRRIISTGTHISSGENKLPPRNVFKDSIIRKIRKNFDPPSVSVFEYTPPEEVTGQVDKPLFD